MPTPCGCDDGDYRAECYEPCPGTEGQPGNPCPGGTYRDPMSGQCHPLGAENPGGSNPAEACRSGGGVWDSVDNVCRPLGKGGGGGGGESYEGYNLPGYPGGFNINSGQPPPFKAPRWSYPDFEPPKPEDIYKDPSYQWRLDQGVKALDRSAAARGTLRSGGTLLGAIEYGQKFGSHEYGNIFDRAVTTYGTNRQTSMDVFDRLYQAAKDEYAPQLLGWQTGVENQRISAQRSWEDWWRRVDDLWRREHAVLTAGQN